MAFSNRIRLPFKLRKPQFTDEIDKYRKANGTSFVLNVIVRKIYEGITDRLPEKIHERLKMALVHDSVTIEGDRYIGKITQDGDYQIEWQDFLDYPLAQAKFKAEVTPFNATNSNCGECQEFTQIVCNDDDAGTLNEDTDYVIDVLSNDDICCNPVSLSLLTFDSNYLDSAVITVDNKIQVHTKSSLPPLTDVQILSYRAECQNGQYDEANVIADINGTAPPVCNAPTDLHMEPIADTHAQANWTQPAGALSYEWKLYLLSDLSTPYQTGDAFTDDNAIDMLPLTPSTEYRFYIRTVCGDSSFSNYIYIDFTTMPAPDTDTCGNYLLENQDFDNFRSGTYIDCNGNTQNINLGPLHNRSICALQSSPGNPVDITVESEIQIIYQGLC